MYIDLIVCLFAHVAICVTWRCIPAVNLIKQTLASKRQNSQLHITCKLREEHAEQFPFGQVLCLVALTELPPNKVRVGLQRQKRL